MSDGAQARDTEALTLPEGIADRILETLEILAITTFTSVDDVTVRAMQWLIKQPEFSGWWKKLRTPAPNAANFTSNLQGEDEAELLVMTEKFMAANAIAGDPTVWINVVFQIFAAIKSFRDKRKAAQPAS